MRATLDIETPVLKDLRELQKREGGTLSEPACAFLKQAGDFRKFPFLDVRDPSAA